MTATKTAVLFYKDAQVKFTQMAVPQTMREYCEVFVPPTSVLLEAPPSKEIQIYKKYFYLKTEIFDYALYEEK